MVDGALFVAVQFINMTVFGNESDEVRVALSFYAAAAFVGCLFVLLEDIFAIFEEIGFVLAVFALCIGSELLQEGVG